MSSAGDKVACRDAAQQYALCIEATPCVQEAKGTVMNCMRDADSASACEVGVVDIATAYKLSPALKCPQPPQRFRMGYYLCRRSQFDNKSRIWGHKFADSGADSEGAASRAK